MQEMGGWSIVEMLRHYAHLAADHLVPFAESLCALRVARSEIHSNYVRARKMKGPASLQALDLMVAGAGF